jgi:hypothetical protein
LELTTSGLAHSDQREPSLTRANSAAGGAVLDRVTSKANDFDGMGYS